MNRPVTAPVLALLLAAAGLTSVQAGPISQDGPEQATAAGDSVCDQARAAEDKLSEDEEAQNENIENGLMPTPEEEQQLADEDMATHELVLECQATGPAKSTPA